MKNKLNILVIDNNREPSCYGSHNIAQWALKMAPAGSQVLVFRAPDQDLPATTQHFDAIIISGSITSCLEKNEVWIQPYDDFVTTHIHQNTPILGICYGHQTLARCLAAIHQEPNPLRIAPQGEFGWRKIEVCAEGRLFKGLPNSFYTFESHYEEVERLPTNALKTAETSHCSIQSFEMNDRPVFGIQFHPEYSIEEGDISVAAKVKKGVRAEWIFNPGQGKKFYNEQVGKTIFGNFFNIASSQS